MNKLLIIPLNDEQWLRLFEIAEKREITIEAAVQEALEHYDAANQ